MQGFYCDPPTISSRFSYLRVSKQNDLTACAIPLMSNLTYSASRRCLHSSLMQVVGLFRCRTVSSSPRQERIVKLCWGGMQMVYLREQNARRIFLRLPRPAKRSVPLKTPDLWHSMTTKPIRSRCGERARSPSIAMAVSIAHSWNFKMSQTNTEGDWKTKNDYMPQRHFELSWRLSWIMLSSCSIQRAISQPDQLVLTRVIHESGRVLLQVIDDMLGYNKLTNRTFAISEDIINIADIVQSVERAQHNTFNHDVTFRTHLDPQIPKAGQGDSLRYRKVVQTLVSNAARITKKGYIHLNITLESEDQEYSTIRTGVVDTSFGVPAASTKALFTSFTQFDNSVTNRYPGLSICKVLAELMGGQIGFQANPEGQGSVFWFTIKLKKCRRSLTANTPATKFKSLQLHSPVVPDHKGEIQRIAIGKRLLLSENNAVDRIIMLRILATLGFSNIDVAFNGKEAVAKTVQTADDTHTSVPYDLILMGTNMPIQDGVSATQELRSRGFQMPILAKTAILRKSRLEEYIAKGMTDIIPHPMRGNALIDILLRYLQTSQDGSRTGF